MHPLEEKLLGIIREEKQDLEKFRKVCKEIDLAQTSPSDQPPKKTPPRFYPEIAVGEEKGMGILALAATQGHYDYFWDLVERIYPPDGKGLYDILQEKLRRRDAKLNADVLVFYYAHEGEIVKTVQKHLRQQIEDYCSACSLFTRDHKMRALSFLKSEADPWRPSYSPLPLGMLADSLTQQKKLLAGEPSNWRQFLNGPAQPHHRKTSTSGVKDEYTKLIDYYESLVKSCHDKLSKPQRPLVCAPSNPSEESKQNVSPETNRDVAPSLASSVLESKQGSGAQNIVADTSNTMQHGQIISPDAQESATVAVVGSEPATTESSTASAKSVLPGSNGSWGPGFTALPDSSTQEPGVNQQSQKIGLVTLPDVTEFGALNLSKKEIDKLYEETGVNAPSSINKHPIWFSV